MTGVLLAIIGAVLFLVLMTTPSNEDPRDRARQPKSLREERERRIRHAEAVKKQSNIRATFVGTPLIEVERQYLVSTVWRCAHGTVSCKATNAVEWGYWKECQCTERLAGTCKATPQSE